MKTPPCPPYERPDWLLDMHNDLNTALRRAAVSVQQAMRKEGRDVEIALDDVYCCPDKGVRMGARGKNSKEFRRRLDELLRKKTVRELLGEKK